MEAFAWAINHFMHILMGLELVLNLIGQRIFFHVFHFQFWSLSGSQKDPLK